MSTSSSAILPAPPASPPPRAGDQPAIVLLGWADLSQGAGDGGGLNLVVSQLAEELARRGRNVVYLRAGMHYSLRKGMRIVPEGTWRGVSCYDFINSPNVSTGNYNFENVNAQIAAPDQSAVVVDFLQRIRAEILHVHVLEGFSFDLIARVKRNLGIPVIVTPHNYFALCPQIDLLRHERQVCDDYDGGRACVGCLRVPDFRWEQRRRARLHSTRRVLGDGLYDALKPAATRVVNFFRPGTVAARQTFQDPGEHQDFLDRRAPGVSPAHERLLANADRHLVVLNDYGIRRRAGVEALCEADLVLPPGRFLMQVHEAMGVSPERLRHVPLGLRHIDALRERFRDEPASAHPPWKPTDARPLRLVYFGNCFVNKGLAVLVDAVASLGPDASRRVRLDIHASGDDAHFRHRLHANRNVRFHGEYTFDRQAVALQRADAGIFAGLALENSPLVVLEMLAAGCFVLAPRRGAVLDFIQDGVNGALFEPGDPADLTRAINAILSGQTPLPARNAVRAASPARAFTEYVDEMESIYAGVDAPAP